MNNGVTHTPGQRTAAEFPPDADAPARMRFLLRYAQLAPSSHNTQPWKFRVSRDGIELFTDPGRWLRVADKDQRELHLSVGCCLENLLLASERFGLRHEVMYFPDGRDPAFVAAVEIGDVGEPSPARPPVLFDMIPLRRTDHRAYNGRPVGDDALARLRDVCPDLPVMIHLSTDPTIRWQVEGMVIRADVAEFADPAFRHELAYWIGQGVFGTPWLMSKLGQLAVAHLDTGRSTARKDVELLEGSPVLGLIASAADDRTSQVRAGQAFQRLWLLATHLGLSLQPVSQLLQVAEVKRDLARLMLPSGQVPLQPFRLGHATPEPTRTPRRPLEEMLV